MWIERRRSSCPLKTLIIEIQNIWPRKTRTEYRTIGHYSSYKWRMQSTSDLEASLF